MPKQQKQINIFNTGTVLNVDEKDIPDDAASFSLNVNPNTQDGILSGIKTHKFITSIDGVSSRALLPSTYGLVGTIMNDVDCPILDDENMVVADVSLFEDSFKTFSFIGTKGYKETLGNHYISPHMERMIISQTHLGITTTPTYGVFYANAAIGTEDVEISVANASTTADLEDYFETGEYIQFSTGDSFLNPFVYEIMKITGISGETLTVKRGCFGSQKQSYATSTNYRIFINRISYNLKGKQSSTKIGYLTGDGFSGMSGNHLKGNNSISLGIANILKHTISGDATKVVFDADAKTMTISGTSSVEQYLGAGDSITIYTTAHGDSNNHGSTFKIMGIDKSNQVFYFTTAPVSETLSSSTIIYFEPSLLKNSTFTHKSASSGVGDDQNYKVNDWYMTKLGSGTIDANTPIVDDDTGAIVQSTNTGIYNDTNLFGGNVSPNYYPYKADSSCLTLTSKYRYLGTNFSQLGVALSDTDTNIILKDSQYAIISFQKGDVIYVDDTADGSSPVEYMRVLSVTNQGIEVERGIYDTKPVAQAADRYIYKNSGYEIKQSIDKNLLKPNTDYELTFWSKLNTGAQATAEWTAVSQNIANYDEKEITLESASGTRKTYTFESSAGTSTGDLDGDKVIVNINGIAVNGLAPAAIATRLETAIEGGTGHNGEITVSRSTAVVTLTQAYHGESGNTQIQTDLLTTVGKFSDSGSTSTSPFFRGGLSAEGNFGIELNGGYFDSEGIWNAFLSSEDSSGFESSLYKPSRYHRYLAFDKCKDLRGIPSKEFQIINNIMWRQLSFRFRTPDREIDTDMILSFGNTGVKDSQISLANINLCEESIIYDVSNLGGFVKSSGFIKNKKIKDLVMYDSNNNLLRILRAFDKDKANLASVSSIDSSITGTMNANSTNKDATFASKNKEVHVGFGSNPSDSNPKWLGYVNHKMFGASTENLYLDTDLIPLYDKDGASNYDKICIAGEWEGVVALWQNSATTLEVDMGSGNTHNLSVGDNIVIREYMDTDNSWTGSGVWYVSALDNAAGGGSTRYFRCRRNADLDPNPPNNGSMADSNNNYIISFRPFYYYAIKRGENFIYRIFPEQRINATSGTGDAVYYKGTVQSSPGLQNRLESICCSYAKNTTAGAIGTDGGHIYALTDNGLDIYRVNVNIPYDSWTTTTPTITETIKIQYRSFKWSNLRTDGNIGAGASDYVFDSIASESSPIVQMSGIPCDILETKGPTVGFDWDDADNKNSDVQPNQLDTRLWIQGYPAGGEEAFTDGDRFLFCGKSEYATGENTMNFADRTPPTVSRYGRRTTWGQYNEIYGVSSYLLLFLDGGGPFLPPTATEQDLDYAGHQDISPSYAASRALYHPTEDFPNTAVDQYFVDAWEKIVDFDFELEVPTWSGHKYEVPQWGTHPYVHWGYNLGWDGSGGKKTAIKVVRYGLFPISDNDGDGIIDGTGVITPNDDNTDKKYGNLGQKMSAHAVGLIGSSELPWIRNGGRMLGWSGRYRAADEELTYHNTGPGGSNDSPVKMHAQDMPGLMDASKVVFVCTDMHFGDFPQKANYTVAVAESTNDYGAGDHKYYTKCTATGHQLQVGDLVYFQGEGDWDGWGNSYYVVAVDASNPNDFYVQELTESPGTAIGSNNSGEVYLGGFQRCRTSDDHYLTARGNLNDDEPYHFAYNDDNPTDGSIFNKHGGFSRLWYTNQNNFGPGILNVDYYFDNAYTEYQFPGIQNYVEQLNFEAGFMIRPFNMDDEGFDKLMIGEYVSIDMPSFPDAVLHNDTTVKTTNWHRTAIGASKLFITAPGEPDDITGDLEDSRIYQCEWNNLFPDEGSHIRVEGDFYGADNLNLDGQANSDWQFREGYGHREQEVLFRGSIASSGQYTDSASATEGYRDATLHPVIKLDMSTINDYNQGADINPPNNGTKFYRMKNCLAGLYITIIHGDANGDSMQTRKIIGSFSLGNNQADDLLVSINYPISAGLASSSFFVWKAAQLCTAPIRLVGEHTTLYQTYSTDYWTGDDYIYNGVPVNRNSSVGQVTLVSTGNTTVATTTEANEYHGLSTNDTINITVPGATSIGYDGTYTITVTGSRTFEFTTLGADLTDSVTAEWRVVNNSTSSAANPISVAMQAPISKWSFGDLDMRKLRKYVVTDTSSTSGAASDELRLTTSTNHLLSTGDMVHLATNEIQAINGPHYIDFVDSTNIDITTPDNTNASSKTYDMITNQWGAMMLSATGDALISEVRAGPKCWDKGDITPNLLRHDATDNSRYMAITDSAVHITPGIASEDTGYFKKSIEYKYKISLIYDGYQEGPLSANSWKFDEPLTYDTVNIKITLIKPSKRCSAVCLYRKDTANSFYRLVKQIPTDTGWLKTGTDMHAYTVNDSGNMYASYEARTGISESMHDLSIKYGLSCELDGYLFVGDCSHKQIKDATNQIFRSKPGRWSIFDWSVDFAILNSTPTAMVPFLGRLIAFDNNTLYKINPQTLTIEDIFEGVGCSGKNSVVVTEYAMFFANRQGAYMYDGQKPVKISQSIQSGGKTNMLSLSSSSTLGTNEIDNLSWENTAGNLKSISPYVTFDSKNNLVYFAVELLSSESFKSSNSSGTSRDDDYKMTKKQSFIWSFSFEKSRWDLWELATDDEDIGKPFTDDSGNVFISIGNGLYQIQGGQEKMLYSWLSKKMIMGVASIKKVFNKIKVVGPKNNLIIDGSDLNDSDKIIVATDEGRVTSGSNSTTSNIVYKSDGTDSADYKLKGSNKTAKWIQFKFEEMDEDIESIGCIFRMRSIK